MLVQHFPTMLHESPTKWLASIIHNSVKDIKTPLHKKADTLKACDSLCWSKKMHYGSLFPPLNLKKGIVTF